MTSDEPIDGLLCLHATDGERLKTLRRTGEDGSIYEVPGYWWDSQLGVACYPRLDVDGVRRCLPISSRPGVRLELAFADEACTQRIGVVPCGEDIPLYAAEYLPDDGDCAGLRSRVYEVGASLGGAGTVYSLNQESCVAQSVDESAQLYELLGEVAPEQFVAVERVEAAGARLRDLRYVLSDGALNYVLSNHDAETNVFCDGERALSGSIQCRPGPRALVYSYSDAACTEPLAEPLVSLGCPGSDRYDVFGVPTAYTVEVLDRGCTTETRVYEPVAEGSGATPDTVFRWDLENPSLCVEESFVSPELVAVGAEVPKGTFPSGVFEPVTCRSWLTAGSRLQVLAFHWEDGKADPSSFFDSEVNSECDVGLATDGVERCLPRLWTGYSTLEGFVDAECTRPAAGFRCPPYAWDPDNHQDFVARSRTIETPEGCESGAAAIFPLTGPELDEVYYIELNGDCALLPPGEAFSPDQAIYRELGPEVPPETFVAFERDY